MSGICFTVVSGLGAWALGRLTVKLNKIESIAGRIALFFALALLAIPIAIGPALALAFHWLEQPPSEALSHGLLRLIVSVSFLFYWAVLYLSFRLGTGRVHGTG